MTNTPNTTISNNLYPLVNGTSSSNPFVWEFQPRDPTVNDYNYPIQKLWLNTANNNIWFLKNFVSSVGVVTANWIFLSTGSAVLETLTGDDGIPVLPVSNNINELGNAVANATHAKPIFFRSGGNPNLDLDVQVSAGAASSNINNAGLASFNSSQFNVDANGFVSSISGSFSWHVITHLNNTTQIVAQNGYVSADNSSPVLLVLPVTGAVGDTFIVINNGTANFQINQNSGQTIHMGTTNTTTGASGNIASLNIGDTVEIICVVTNTDWRVQNANGNLILT